MKTHQLSLFVENRPGRLSAACRVLAEEGINLLTLSLADTQQFGVLRLIVRDPEKAKRALEAAGHVVKVTEVVAVEVADRPGGLEAVLDVIDRAQINIDYLYSLTFRRKDRAVLIFRFSDPDAAVRALQSSGVPVVAPDELYRLVDA